MGYPAGQYYHARDYETDLAKQFVLYERAATGGDPLAQWALGSIYENASLYLDLDKAAYWYTKAAQNGNEMGNQARFRLGLPDINGNWPVNRTVLTTSPSEIVLDDHTTVAAAAAAVGIALVLMTAGQDGSVDSNRELYCVPCNYEEADWPDNQCMHRTTGAMRSRICYP